MPNKKRTVLMMTIIVLCFSVIINCQAKGISEMKSDEKSSFDHDLFMSAVLSNNQSKVKDMIASSDYDPNYRFPDGTVYFENVLVFMNCEMAVILFDSGVDPYLMTSSGETIKERINNGDSRRMKKILKRYL